MHNEAVDNQRNSFLRSHLAEAIHEHENYRSLLVVETRTQEHADEVVQDADVWGRFWVEQSNDWVGVWKGISPLSQQLK